MEKRSLSHLICSGIPQKNLEECFKIFREYPPGMVLLFSENITGKEEVKELCKEIKKIKGKPLIAVDMEGGKVNRLKKIIGEMPSAEEMGKKSDEVVEKLAFKWGKEMRKLGIDVDFAPCVDLGPVKENTGLESRVYSDVKEKVLRKGMAFLKGMHSAGILGCIKHFPGLGPSEVDSHFQLPIIKLKKDEVKKHIDIFYFLKKYSPIVMVSHSILKVYDEKFPSSLSKKIIKLLKPYKGLIISDDLEMGALSNYGDLIRRTILSLKAGCQMVILSHKFYEIPSIVQNLNFKGKIIDYLNWKRRATNNVKRTFAARY